MQFVHNIFENVFTDAICLEAFHNLFSDAFSLKNVKINFTDAICPHHFWKFF